MLIIIYRNINILLKNSLYTTFQSCLVLDNCASEPCSNATTCVNGMNTLTCDCVVGFTGTFCQTGTVI